MTSFVRSAALSLLLLASPAFAAHVVELRDPAPVLVSALTMQKLSVAQVRRAITLGAATHGWAVKSDSGDAIVLRLDKLKYAVEVRLPYSADGYRIEYLNSANLNYRIEAPSSAPNVFPTPGVEPDPNAKPVAMIHSSYQRWMVNLTQAINAQLSVMVSER